MSFKRVWLCFNVVTITWLNNVIADGDPEKCKMFPIFKECASQLNVDVEELKAMKKAGSFEAVNPCLLDCVAKKMGVIDANGMFDVDAAKSKFVEMVPMEFQDKVSSVASACAKVNDAPINDGDENCERAKLLFSCIEEHKSELHMGRK